MLRDLRVWVRFLPDWQFLLRFLPGCLPLPPHMPEEERWRIPLSCTLQHSQRLWKLSASQFLSLWRASLSESVSAQRAAVWVYQPRFCVAARLLPLLWVSAHSGCQKTHQKACKLHVCWWHTPGLMSTGRQKHGLMQHSFFKSVTEVKIFFSFFD